jgi:hypothetical protein
MTQQLDHLAMHEAARLTRRPCPYCSGEDEATASGATGAQPAGSPFGLWQGWSPAVGLADLLAGRSPTPFQRRGVNLYRISFPGAGRRVSIGMTVSNSIATRVNQHARTQRGERRIRQLIDQVPQQSWNTIRVQAGMLRGRVSPRIGHMYEIWLQQRERVFDWSIIQNTRTFETELEI